MQVAFPMLEQLKLFGLDSIKMLWPDNLPKVPYMHNLKILYVSGCDSLKYLFSFAMARSFVQLKELKVRKCETIEDVLVLKEGGEEGRLKDTTILFPQLESLWLYDLPNLRRFSGGDFVTKDCPSLRYLTIQKCPKLKTFINTCTEEVEETEEPFFSEKVLFLSFHFLFYIFLFIFLVFK